MDLVDEALILQIEYNCEKILFFADQLNVEAHNSLRAPYNIVNMWYGSDIYIELIQRREAQLLQVIEEGLIDGRFTSFVTIAEQFSPQSYEIVKLEYLKFQQQQLLQWIEESSYKDAQAQFEGYTGPAFYAVVKNYAEKGMEEDVQRVIELYKAYPVVEKYAQYEVGMREYYIESIEEEANKQLMLFAQERDGEENRVVESGEAVLTEESGSTPTQESTDLLVEPTQTSVVAH